MLYAMPKTVLLTGEANGFIVIKSVERGRCDRLLGTEVRQILLEEADRLQKEVRFVGWDRC